MSDRGCRTCHAAEGTEHRCWCWRLWVDQLRYFLLAPPLPCPICGTPTRGEPIRAVIHRNCWVLGRDATVEDVLRAEKP